MADGVGAMGRWLAAPAAGLARLVFPPQCIACGALVEGSFALCGPCWRETRFISGLVCDGCGAPLPGPDDGMPAHCDDCLAIARPWHRGRAVLLYEGTGRALVLALKHGDRLELARPMGAWLARAAGPILQDEPADDPSPLVAPVPLHRWRLLTRRHNQAAELSRALARAAGLDVVPDLLIRRRATASQDGKGREARFANLEGAIRVRSSRAGRLAGRHVLLVDDVMTSGATLAASAESCLAAGAARVSVLALARVVADGPR